MSRIPGNAPSPTSAYRAARYFTLHELCRLRASSRIGTMSPANIARDRRALILAAVKLRAA